MRSPYNPTILVRNAIGVSDAERPRGSHCNAANMNTDMDTAWHIGVHEIAGLEPVDALGPHPIPVGEA